MYGFAISAAIRQTHATPQSHCLDSSEIAMAAPLAAENTAASADVLVVAPIDPVGGVPALPKSKAKARAKALPKGRIDIDERIDEAKASLKAAAKAMGVARSQARNEKRKKVRLTRKAAQLSAEDLDRIAVLKRTGLWAPELSDPNISRVSEGSAAAMVTAISPVAVPVADAPVTPNGGASSGSANAVSEAVAIDAGPGDVEDSSTEHVEEVDVEMDV